MEPENLNIEETQEEGEVADGGNVLNKVTPLSKYLAMALFIIMPFVGGWIGYQYAPEKVVEVQKVEFIEKEVVEYVEKIDEPIYITPVFLDDFYTEDNDEYYYGVGGEKYFWSWKDNNYNDGVKVLRVFNPLPMEEGMVIQTFTDVDIDTFEVLEDSFAKDKNNIYFFGYYPSVDSGLIADADSETFEIKDLFGFGRNVLFATDKNSLYFLTKKLEGINPETAYMDDKGIIRDEDTFWFPSGGCHFADFRLGTKEEIETFIPPC